MRHIFRCTEERRFPSTSLAVVRRRYALVVVDHLVQLQPILVEAADFKLASGHLVVAGPENAKTADERQFAKGDVSLVAPISSRSPFCVPRRSGTPVHTSSPFQSTLWVSPVGCSKHHHNVHHKADRLRHSSRLSPMIVRSVIPTQRINMRAVARAEAGAKGGDGAT